MDHVIEAGAGSREGTLSWCGAHKVVLRDSKRMTFLADFRV